MYAFTLHLHSFPIFFPIPMFEKSLSGIYYSPVLRCVLISALVIVVRFFFFGKVFPLFLCFYKFTIYMYLSYFTNVLQ